MPKIKNKQLLNCSIRYKRVKCSCCGIWIDITYTRTRDNTDLFEIPIYCPECHDCLGGIAATGLISMHRPLDWEYISEEYERMESEMDREAYEEKIREWEEDERIAERIKQERVDSLCDAYQEYVGQKSTEPSSEQKIEFIADALAEETAALQDLREEMEAEAKAEALYQLEQSHNKSNVSV